MAIALFYCFIFFTIPAFAGRAKKIMGLIYAVSSFLLYCVLMYISRGAKDLSLLFHPLQSFLKTPFVDYCVFVFFEYLIYALGYWFAMDSINKARNIKLLEQQKIEIENQFLKEQLSPHFLYNTLSYFYTKTIDKNPEVADGIIILTDILRYSLKMDTDRVPLAMEVEHIENLVMINNLRFNNKLNIVFLNETDPDFEYEIISHSLITLVENAFKYGDLLDKDNPVRFFLSTDKTGIHFKLVNKKTSAPKAKSNGIGLKNLRRRLDFLYKDGYTLSIKDEDIWYTAELFIKGKI